MKVIKVLFKNFIFVHLLLAFLLVPLSTRAQERKNSEQFTAQHLDDVLPFFVIGSEMDISPDEPWIIVLPDRTANDSSSTAGVIRLYNQLPDNRKKKGIILVGSLTHLKNIAVEKKNMTSFQLKMYKDDDWIKTKITFVDELVLACGKANVDLWINTNLGNSDINFVKLTKK